MRKKARMDFPIGLTLGTIGALGLIALVVYLCEGYYHMPRPPVEVRVYNDTPANFRDGLGCKKFQPGDFPDGYNTMFKYVMVSNRGDLLNGTTYRRRFWREGDVFHKSAVGPDSASLVIFSNYKPDPKSAIPEERERAKWLKVKKGPAATASTCEILGWTDQKCEK
jgi:hypothetical protein